MNQDFIVYAIVAAATVFLLRLWLWPAKKGGCASGCGGCGKDATKSAAPSDGLIQITMQPNRRNNAPVEPPSRKLPQAPV